MPFKIQKCIRISYFPLHVLSENDPVICLADKTSWRKILQGTQIFALPDNGFLDAYCGR